MSDRDRPQEPDDFDESIADLGEFRGVVLDGTVTVDTVTEPPPEPAQPASAPAETS